MLTVWQACLTSIATGMQSYSIAGRSMTRANLAEVSDTVAEISYALQLKSGAPTVVREVYSDMSS